MSDYTDKQQKPESLRGNLEKNCKTKRAIDQHGTAYLCVDWPCVTFSVYGDLNETVTEFMGFGLNDVSEEIN